MFYPSCWYLGTSISATGRNSLQVWASTSTVFLPLVHLPVTVYELFMCGNWGSQHSLKTMWTINTSLYYHPFCLKVRSPSIEIRHISPGTNTSTFRRIWPMTFPLSAALKPFRLPSVNYMLSRSTSLQQYLSAPDSSVHINQSTCLGGFNTDRMRSFCQRKNTNLGICKRVWE